MEPCNDLVQLSDGDGSGVLERGQEVPRLLWAEEAAPDNNYCAMLYDGPRMVSSIVNRCTMQRRRPLRLLTESIVESFIMRFAHGGGERP